MMDCGFTLVETKARLERAGPAPSDIAAVVVTPEHDDHLGGVARFAKRYAIPVYLTRGTPPWLPPDFPAVLVPCIGSHRPLQIDAVLSRQNNTPELAVDALSDAAGCEREWICVATQDDGFAWRDA